MISRHGRPALDRMQGPRLSWRDYISWWAHYEAGGLAEGQTAPASLKLLVEDAAVVLASGRLRAQQTARSAAPHLAALHEPLFNEAPLPPPCLYGLKVLPRTWNILARTAWLAGHTLDGESHAGARIRARLAAGRLHEAAAAGKVYLAAHGWFNRMLRPELRRLGWICLQDGGDAYWSYRIYHYAGPPDVSVDE